MDAIGGNAGEMLRSYAARIVRLRDEIAEIKDEQIKPLQSDVKDIFAEAQSQGFDKKALEQAIRRMQMDPDHRAIVETYEAALIAGMMGEES